MLLTADDTTSLRLHEILLLEATGCVLGSTMEHLGLRANSHAGTAILLLVLSVSGAVAVAILTSGVGHF